MNSFDNDKLFNNDNLEEKNRLSHFSPVLLKKKGTKLVFLYKGQRYAVDTESDESRENCKETSIVSIPSTPSIGSKKKQERNSGCCTIQNISTLNNLILLNVYTIKKVIMLETH